MESYKKKLEYLKRKTSIAESLIRRINDHQDMLKQIKQDDGWFDSPFVVKFANDKEFQIPNNFNLTIFKNIIESSIEIETERLTKQLDELLSEGEFDRPISNWVSV